MNIPINTPILGKEELQEVLCAIKEGSLTSSANEGGKRVQEFEGKLSDYVKSRFAVAVNSGTAALQAALYAIDIKKGDEVLVPSFSFVATANAVVSVGARPVFVDILKENYTLDPNDLQRKISKKSKAVIPVHLYGNVAYMDDILEIARKHGLDIIEDAAQSLGSTFKGKATGTFGQLGCFSTYAAKVMTSGEGGALVTNSKELFEKLRRIRNHGMYHGGDTNILGLNLRMPEFNAAIAKIQMIKLSKFLRIRKNNGKILSGLLSDLDIKLPQERKNEEVNWYLYTIATKKRNHLLKALNKNGIKSTVYYSHAIHQTPFYRSKVKLPNTEWATSNVLSLPIHPLVTKQGLHLISKIIHENILK